MYEQECKSCDVILEMSVFMCRKIDCFSIVILKIAIKSFLIQFPFTHAINFYHDKVFIIFISFLNNIKHSCFSYHFIFSSFLLPIIFMFKQSLNEEKRRNLTLDLSQRNCNTTLASKRALKFIYIYVYLYKN